MNAASRNEDGEDNTESSLGVGGNVTPNSGVGIGLAGSGQWKSYCRGILSWCKDLYSVKFQEYRDSITVLKLLRTNAVHVDVCRDQESNGAKASPRTRRC